MMIVPRPSISFVNIIAPLGVSVLFVAGMSALREPSRRKLSALLIAGAGTAYYGGGFRWWEVVFCAVLLWLAFRGWDSYRYIGFGWVLHIVWDILHHLYGQSILPFLPLSSLGCAICDSGIAIWYFAGAPSIINRSKRAAAT